LPKLDAKRSLVPVSGKTFVPADTRSLRAAWDASQKQSAEDYLIDWHLIGPFPARPNGCDGLSLETGVESKLGRGGAVDLEAPFKVAGATLRWQPALANRRGYVDLGKLLGKVEWAVAYAYAEVDSVHARDAILRCGSDDGIKIWVNGRVVHHHEVGRAYRPDSDSVPVRLEAGRNRILVKVDNYHGGWGFGVAIGKPMF
ncbi:MAG TPA: hypothetical protein VGI81_09665, partial [Tepidisphaeraceae bacterium]